MYVHVHTLYILIYTCLYLVHTITSWYIQVHTGMYKEHACTYLVEKGAYAPGYMPLCPGLYSQGYAICLGLYALGYGPGLIYPDFLDWYIPGTFTYKQGTQLLCTGFNQCRVWYIPCYSMVLL